MKKKLQLKYLLKVYYKNGRVLRIQRTSKARLSATLQRKNDSDVKKYYLKVSYSQAINSDNKKYHPINEAEYFTKKDLFMGLEAFATSGGYST